MANETRRLLSKFEKTAALANAPQASSSGLEVMQAHYLAVYRKKNLWPGQTYAFVGNSYNVEYKIIGSDFEARRAGCIGLMIEKLGNHQDCVLLKEAFSFYGFAEILSRFERDWLKRLPEDVLVGPAYEQSGQRVRHAFAVWRPSYQQASKNEHLVHA